MGLKFFMLSTSNEKRLSEYEPRTYRPRPRSEESRESKTTSTRREGPLFRVDFSRVLEKKERFVFSKFVNDFVE